MIKGIFEPIPYLQGERVSKAELSQLLGVPIIELDQWVRRGCPCERTGGIRSPLIFDTAQSIAWRIITTAQTEGGEKAGLLVRLVLEREALEAELERRVSS